ncbi:hypothetical protein SAMN05444920_1603 [Nonomuraea solani]|uniref:Uncharacterized protein n=1 Tax=Nonomuraea solani TaxID=1144553 RepID=A0A1H6F1S1_9ACTN|nr:hypothetical protein SAMN05444920_1603 [Nonomuraea solani]
MPAAATRLCRRSGWVRRRYYGALRSKLSVDRGSRPSTADPGIPAGNPTRPQTAPAPPHYEATRATPAVPTIGRSSPCQSVHRSPSSRRPNSQQPTPNQGTPVSHAPPAASRCRSAPPRRTPPRVRPGSVRRTAATGSPPAQHPRQHASAARPAPMPSHTYGDDPDSSPQRPADPTASLATAARSGRCCQPQTDPSHETRGPLLDILTEDGWADAVVTRPVRRPGARRADG